MRVEIKKSQSFLCGGDCGSVGLREEGGGGGKEKLIFLSVGGVVGEED